MSAREAGSPATTDDDPVVHPWWIRHPRVLEYVGAAVTALALVTSALFLLTDQIAAVPAAMLVIQTAGVVIAWRRPGLGSVLVAAAPIAAGAMGAGVLYGWMVAVLCAFTTAVRGWRPGILTVLTAVSAYGAVVIAHGFDYTEPEALIAGSMAVAAVATGTAVRNQRRWVDSVEQRARDAADQRERETQRRIVEERLRIARDLHDSVGHEVAGVSMQLALAQVSLPTTGVTAKAREALETARTHVQAVTKETGHILDVLRAGDDDRRPGPSIEGLPALIGSYRTMGLDVDADIAALDEATIASSALGAAIYRIVQEALTNAHRHGRGTADLRITRDAESVCILVSNPISPTDSKGTGHGLTGMRERAHSLGGTLTIDATPTHFTMRATLPAHL